MYEKQTWKNGDVITEDKLNHIEDGIATGGGIYTYGEVAVFDGEVTTVQDRDVVLAEIILQGELPKSDISVTFNGQNYTLPYGNYRNRDYWGELDSNHIPAFENYPLTIIQGEEACTVFTESAGTYSLKINEKVQKLEVNDSFASEIATGMVVNVGQTGSGCVLDKKYGEIYSAVMKGQNIIFINTTAVLYLYNISSDSIVLLNESGIDTQGNVLFGKLHFRYETEDGYPSTYEVN